MSKPVIVLTPGAWHSPEIYAAVAAYLSPHGYETKAVALPSVGAEPPVQDFHLDVAAIREVLEDLIVRQGRDVVLGLHSYSSLPGSDAAKDLGKPQRTKQGLKGGISRVVLLAGHVEEEGYCPFASGGEAPKWMNIDMEKGIVTVTPEDAEEVFYHDLTPEKADEWAGKIQHQSAGVFTSTMTYCVWKHIPSTYVRSDADRGYFTAAVVDAMLKKAREIEPTSFDGEERTDAGHIFMLSRPKWLGDVLRRAAGESV